MPKDFENMDFSQMAKGLEFNEKLPPERQNKPNLAHDVMELAKTGIETYGAVKTKQIDDRRKAQLNTIEAIKTAAALANIGLKATPGMFGTDITAEQAQQINEAQARKDSEGGRQYKPTEASEWYSEDLSDPQNPRYFYNQVVRDAKGLRTEKVPADAEAYKRWKGRTPQPRPDIVDKPTETQVRLAGYTQRQDSNGQYVWIPKPPAQAKAALMALREIYKKQGNSNGVDYIDAELSQYKVAPIGAANVPPDPPNKNVTSVCVDNGTTWRWNVSTQKWDK